MPLEIRIAAADALGQAGDPRLDPHRGDYWVPIPAGKFLMGAQNKDPQKPNYDEMSTERINGEKRLTRSTWMRTRSPVIR